MPNVCASPLMASRPQPKLEFHVPAQSPAVASSSAPMAAVPLQVWVGSPSLVTGVVFVVTVVRGRTVAVVPLGAHGDGRGTGECAGGQREEEQETSGEEAA